MQWQDHMSILGIEVNEAPVNVFYLDHNPEVAARYHVDRHVVKMILETAQLLSTAWHVLAPELIETDWNFLTEPDVLPEGELRTIWTTLAGQRIYRKTHEHHPSADWARSTGGNYRWLHALGIYLLDEYRHRFGRRHATAPVLWTLEILPPPLRESLETQTQPPPTMPPECKVLDGSGQYYDTVASYRQYYVQRKQAMFRWTNRRPPAWASH